jgi:N-acetylneuraminate synthase
MAVSAKIDRLFESAHPPVYLIAEIGINHNGSLETALRLVEAARDAGADAVKFQKRDLEALYPPALLADPNGAEWSFHYVLPILQRCELDAAAYAAIGRRCAELGLDLIVTPFDQASAAFVRELGVPAIKIASADMPNFDLIRTCAAAGRPLLVSTGMWRVDEIEQCVAVYRTLADRFALLLCNSTYPAPYESIGLGVLRHLRTLAPVVGYSGHERGHFVPIAAVALGARIVEKHLTFDREQEGPDHRASLTPPEFARMAEEIRHLECALGGRKTVGQAEILNRELFGKSATARRALAAGVRLSRRDITFRGPGKGLFPHQIDRFYGRRLGRAVAAGETVTARHFDGERDDRGWEGLRFAKSWGLKCRFHDYEGYRQLGCRLLEFHLSDEDLQATLVDGSAGTSLVVHAPEIRGRQLVDLCASDAASGEASVALLQRTIDRTIALGRLWGGGRPKLVVHLGGMLPTEARGPDVGEAMLRRAQERFGQLRFSADDIEILPENLPPRPWYLGGEWYQYGFVTSDQMIRFCAEFGLGMTFDLCHAQLHCSLAGGDLVAYARRVAPRVRHVHISDALGVREEGLQIGDGEIDFGAVLEPLRPIDFSWVPEIWRGHQEGGRGALRALRALEPYAGVL